jgi:D-3-phosphoglycerate dehydrogenase / 2-oxoglutarate reductase
MRYRVLITDYFYPTLDEERRVFAGTPIEIVDGNGRCTTPADVIALGANADALITQFVPITAPILDRLPRCKVIVRYAIGLDTIDIAAATARRVMVANVPDYCIAEVSDHALALILALVRKVKVMDAEVQQGRWGYQRAAPVRRLADLTLGLIGFGHIAREVARKGRALGFGRLCAFDPYVHEGEPESGVTLLPLESVLAQADVLSIHAPATAETRHLIGEAALGRMKRGAFLVNTSRGPLVEEAALARALRDGQIAGAALDVLEDEQRSEASALRGLENVILTPHMAWYSTGAVQELQRKVAEQVREALLTGRPTYWVNPF